MMWYYGGGGGWIGWLVMGLGMIVFWVVVVGAILLAVRAFSHHPPGVPPGAPPMGPPPQSSALHILEERFARGEISAEEFNERKRTLLGG